MPSRDLAKTAQDPLEDPEFCSNIDKDQGFSFCHVGAFHFVPVPLMVARHRASRDDLYLPGVCDRSRPESPAEVYLL